VEQIRALDTSAIAPTSHVLVRPFDREDEVAPTLPRHEALANAPDAATQAGLFKVPRVLG
jgi:aspartyl/glutamyl-tRNA(Asn/Gln) amidotransferase C subunit